VWNESHDERERFERVGPSNASNIVHRILTPTEEQHQTMTQRRLTTQLTALGTLIADRWPDRIEHRLVAQLAATLPRSLEHLATVVADGFPASTPGAPDRGNGGRSESELTSVESAVEARLRLSDPDPERSPAEAYAGLCAAVVAAAVAVADEDRMAARRQLRAAQRIVDRWQPPVVEAYRQLRCTPPADEATAPWARPDCENVAAPNRRGLCDACSMRRHRWLRAQEGAA
jgi:hypothetical protein